MDEKLRDEARLIFAGVEESGRELYNDFLVEGIGNGSGEREARSISRVLLEVIAHKRSLLFGLSLANRFVNVMLPHALLTSVDACEGEPPAWFVQPLVSFIRDGRDPSDVRRMYAMTLFLIPVEGAGLRARPMSKREIDAMVNAGWSLASPRGPEEVSRFAVHGPLPGYIGRLSRFDLASLLRPPPEPECSPEPRSGEGCASISLRRGTELLAFGLALSVAQGSDARAGAQTERRIGKGVVTSLDSARASSVLVIDEKLTEEHVRRPLSFGFPPGRFGSLMKALSSPDARAPKRWSVAEQRKHRLDRPFVDDDTYAVGVLPQSRCLLVVRGRCAKHLHRESPLMQAGSVAYMTIGAATAIGTMRVIDSDLERMEDSEPGKIADIEGEIATDLHEIYDLDITREAYRSLYRLMRKRLGIIRDYETLQEKMRTLSREISTRYQVKTQARLEWLTAVIVALSVLILLGTIVVAIKP